MCDYRSLKTLKRRVQAPPPLSLHSGSTANGVCDSGPDRRWVFCIHGSGNSYIPSIERQTPKGGTRARETETDPRRGPSDSLAREISKRDALSDSEKANTGWLDHAGGGHDSIYILSLYSRCRPPVDGVGSSLHALSTPGAPLPRS